MIASWGDYFHQVSWGLIKDCEFFTNGQFLSVSGFFLLRPYKYKLGAMLYKSNFMVKFYGTCLFLKK